MRCRRLQVQYCLGDTPSLPFAKSFGFPLPTRTEPLSCLCAFHATQRLPYTCTHTHVQNRHACQYLFVLHRSSIFVFSSYRGYHSRVHVYARTHNTLTDIHIYITIYLKHARSKKYMHKRDLTRHKESKHNGFRQFICDFKDCHKVFAAKQTLTDHKRSHTDPYPFICPVAGCGGKFKYVYMHGTRRADHRVWAIECEKLIEC